MLLIFTVFLRLISTEETPRLAWASAAIGGCHCTSLEASAAVIQVPAIYTPPMGQVKIFVKRYMRKGATFVNTHLIMLPGGPGQDETVFEPSVQQIADFLGGDVAIYLVDMRGTGQSQPFGKPNDSSCLRNVDQLAATASFPIASITLSNAARDVLELATAIRASPEFTSSSQLHIYGVSFGADWAYRTLLLDTEGRFQTALFDGIAAFDGLIAPNNDEPLLANCDSHPFCRAQFGGKAENARKMLAEILVESRNPCTAKLVAHLEGSKMRDIMTPEYQLFFFLQPLLEGDSPLGARYHSVQLAMAFIKATHSCHEPAAYDGVLKTVQGCRGGGMAHGSSPGAINRLVNVLLFSGEAYNLHGGGGVNCGPPTLTHQCMLYFMYKRAFEGIRQYSAPRDSIYNKKPEKTKLYFVHGEVDIVTPIRPVEALASRNGARMIKYRNQGHALVSSGECAQPIWREAILGESSSATDRCMNTVNSVPLDWTFKHIPAYKAWFDPKIDAVANYIDDAPQPSLGGGVGIVIWVVIAIVMVFIAGAAAFFVYKKRAT